MVNIKICSKCKIPKDISEFKNGKGYKGGRVNWCKICRNKYEKKRYQKPEVKKRKNEYGRRYNKENRKHIRAYNKYKIYIKRDKEAGFIETVDFSFEEFENKTKNECCYTCGRDITETDLGLDHIDNIKGHSKDNTLVCCGRCNRTRGNRFTVEEFKSFSIILRKIDKLRKK